MGRNTPTCGYAVLHKLIDASLRDQPVTFVEAVCSLPGVSLDAVCNLQDTHRYSLTCEFGKPYLRGRRILAPVARPAGGRQVGEDVKTALRKRNYMVHLAYNLSAECRVTVGALPEVIRLKCPPCVAR